MKIEGVILAAGLSSRAGTYKMTLEIDGQTIIEKCIENMYEFCSRIILVGGYKIENLIPILDKYPKVELVHNTNYRNGMFSSVMVGLQNVRGERCFFTPGDYPKINKDVYQTLLNREGDIIIPVCQGQKGHPILLKSSVIRELLNSQEYPNRKYKSLREFIYTKRPVLVDVDDPGILEDVDTMEDYERLSNS